MTDKPKRCAGSTYAPNMWPRTRQRCRNPPKGDTEFCGIHAPKVDTGLRVYRAWINDRNKVEVQVGIVVKKTTKRYTLAKRLPAFDYSGTIALNDAFLTRTEALVYFLSTLKQRAEIEREEQAQALARLAKAIKEAGALLAKEDA